MPFKSFVLSLLSLILSACGSVAMVQSSCERTSTTFPELAACINWSVGASANARMQNSPEVNLYMRKADELSQRVQRGEMSDQDARAALSEFKRTPAVASDRQSSANTVAPVEQPNAKIVAADEQPSGKQPGAEFAAPVDQSSKSSAAPDQQPRADVVASVQQSSLKTPRGTEMALTISHYQYEEPSLAVTLKGYKGGIDFSQIFDARDDWFVRLDGRYDYGKADYSGSGTKNNNTDWYYELRGVIGKDFDQGTYSLAPYIGLGFRYLYNNITGVTSTGAIGYQRESQYSYIPVGVTHRLVLESRAGLATTIEFDYLVQGRQKSSLSDFNPAFNDITNDQNHGFGFRGSMFYEKDNWLFGPWFQYWKINQSSVDDLTATAGGVTVKIGFGLEPPNKTTEIGLRLGYRF